METNVYIVKSKPDVKDIHRIHLNTRKASERGNSEVEGQTSKEQIGKRFSVVKKATKIKLYNAALYSTDSPKISSFNLKL